MYQTVKSPDYLKNYIDCFWLGDAESFTAKPNTHHAIASSKTELLFFYSGNYVTTDATEKIQKVPPVGIFGQTTNYKHYFAATAKTSIFGIRLFPLGLLTLFRIPANEFTNQTIDACAVLGNHGNEFTEKILEVATFLEKVNKTIEFFNNQLQSIPAKYMLLADALQKMQQSNNGITLPDLVAQSCLSARQFERNFKILTGFSAKTYLKLIKFERLIETISFQKNVPGKKLIDIALDFGYYDQSHLNHHFKEFTGVNPMTYFSHIASTQYE